MSCLIFRHANFFRLTAAAALALALTACGGGAGSTGASSTGASSTGASSTGASSSNTQAASQPVAVHDAKPKEFTLVDRESFRIGLTQDSEGNEVLLFPGANQQTQELTIKSRDAEGNITDFSSAHFSAITSLLGNRIGILFTPSPDSVNAVFNNIDHISQYVFLSNDFTQITDSFEFFGKTYDFYSGTKFNNLAEDDGPAKKFLETKLEENDIEDEGYNEIDEFMDAFADEGYRDESDNTEEFVVKAKAYKCTINDKTTYVVIVNIRDGVNITYHHVYVSR